MEIFLKMKWSVREAKNGFFITSDNPVVCRISRGTHRPIYRDHGFLNKTAEVTFPLSPKRLLVLMWDESINGVFPISRSQVNHENESRAEHSDKFLYAHFKHKNLMKMAHRYKDSRPGMMSTGFGPEKFAKINVPRKRKK